VTNVQLERIEPVPDGDGRHDFRVTLRAGSEILVVTVSAVELQSFCRFQTRTLEQTGRLVAADFAPAYAPAQIVDTLWRDRVGMLLDADRQRAAG
jgi:hypothetical protein